MTKAELVWKIAEKSEITKVQAEKALSAFVDIINNDVFKVGDKVSIPGLGTFKQTKLAAKLGRNPSTGATLNIPERIKLSFKAAKH